MAPTPDLGILEYKTREEIPLVTIDEAVKALEQKGIPHSDAVLHVQKMYESVPTAETYEKMKKARRCAEERLPDLADEVLNDIPLIRTSCNYPLMIGTGPPTLKGDGVIVPVYLKKQLRVEGKQGIEVSYLHVWDIYVEERPGVPVVVKTPQRGEFRRSALEAALDRFALPFPES